MFFRNILLPNHSNRKANFFFLWFFTWKKYKREHIGNEVCLIKVLNIIENIMNNGCYIYIYTYNGCQKSIVLLYGSISKLYIALIFNFFNYIFVLNFNYGLS